MPKTDFKIFDTEMLTQLFNDQRRVPQLFAEAGASDKEAIDIEQQSADFLAGFAKGEIIVTEDARALLPDYFRVLKHSSHPQIAGFLERAENKYKTAVIREKKQKEQKEILSVPRDDLTANQFAVLQNKKKAGLLTSADLLFIAEKLDAEKGYSTTSLKSKLRSYAENRIAKILKGEISSDEDFNKLVLRFGTVQQNMSYQSKARPTVSRTVIREKPEVSPAPTPTPVISKEPEVSPEPAPTPVVEVVSPIEEPVVENTSRKETFLKHKQHLQELSANGFAILENKKRMASLEAYDLLLLSALLSLQIDETEKNTRPYNVLKRKHDILSSFAQKRIQDSLDGKIIPDARLDELVDTLGTYQQKDTFRNRGCRPFVGKEEIEEQPVIIINETGNENKEEKEVKQEIKEEKKENKPTRVKDPWYKKLWNKTKRVAIIVGVAAVSLFGLAKFAQHSSSPDNTDNAPKTEQAVKTVKTPVTQQKTNTATNFKEVQQEVKTQAQTKQTVAQTNVQTETKQTVAQTQDLSQLSKEDAKCAKRTAKFLKKIAQKHNISVEDAQTKLNDFVNSLDLPQGVSSQRMGYLASIHALFPNSEFGITVNKVFDGEKVDISKEDISKLDKEFSKSGKFGHKNNKYNSTLQIMKAHTR